MPSLNDHTKSETDALRRELDLLTQRLVRMEGNFKTIQEDSEYYTVQDTHAAAIQTSDLEHNPNYNRQEFEPEDSSELMNSLDNRLNSEIVDSKWAMHMENVMSEAIQTSPGSQINNIDCRTSICKTEFTHNDPMVAMEFRLEFLPQVSSSLASGSMQQIDMEDGSQKSIVFFNREDAN